MIPEDLRALADRLETGVDLIDLVERMQGTDITEVSTWTTMAEEVTSKVMAANLDPLTVKHIGQLLYTLGRRLEHEVAQARLDHPSQFPSAEETTLELEQDATVLPFRLTKETSS